MAGLGVPEAALPEVELGVAAPGLGVAEVALVEVDLVVVELVWLDCSDLLDGLLVFHWLWMLSEMLELQQRCTYLCYMCIANRTRK